MADKAMALKIVDRLCDDVLQPTAELKTRFTYVRNHLPEADIERDNGLGEIVWNELRDLEFLLELAHMKAGQLAVDAGILLS